MHLCAQNYQPAVTQSSQQLVTSNVNSLKDCSNFNKLFLIIQKHVLPKQHLCFLQLSQKQSLFPQNSIDQLSA